MAWCLFGAKPLPIPILTFWPCYYVICIICTFWCMQTSMQMQRKNDYNTSIWKKIRPWLNHLLRCENCITIHITSIIPMIHMKKVWNVWRLHMLIKPFCDEARLLLGEIGHQQSYMCHHWLRWLVPCSVPSHYLTQWWLLVNSLWPSDAIWQYRSGSTLLQIMACCLMAKRWNTTI